MPKSIKKITFFLFALRVLRMLFSVVTLSLSATYFGVSVERDVWVLVSTFLAVICSAIWGPLNEVFRTKFVFIKEMEGEVYAISKTASLIGFMVWIILIVSLFLFLFSEEIAIGMTESLSSFATTLFSTMLVVLIPTFLINQLTSFGISILNAYDTYYLPEFIGVLSGIINLGAIVLLAPIIGIYSLVVSMYLSILILLLVVVVALRKKHIHFGRNVIFFKMKDVKIFLLFALPFFFPYFVGQCNMLAEKWLAAFLGSGNVSSLDYARQFTAILQSVLSSVLTTVMVPMLAKAFAKKNGSEFARILNENLIVCLGIMCLAIPILVGAAHPLCNFFFSRKSISLESLELIVCLTRLYGVAFIGVLIYLISGMSLLASGKNKQYALWGIIAQLFVLALNILLYRYVNVYVFPISWGISHLISAIFMFSILDVAGKGRILLCFAKYLLFILFATLVLYLFNRYFIFQASSITLLLNISLLILLVVLLLKDERRNVSLLLKKLF